MRNPYGYEDLIASGVVNAPDLNNAIDAFGQGTTKEPEGDLYKAMMAQRMAIGGIPSHPSILPTQAIGPQSPVSTPMPSAGHVAVEDLLKGFQNLPAESKDSIVNTVLDAHIHQTQPAVEQNKQLKELQRNYRDMRKGQEAEKSLNRTIEEQKRLFGE